MQQTLCLQTLPKEQNATSKRKLLSHFLHPPPLVFVHHLWSDQSWHKWKAFSNRLAGQGVCVYEKESELSREKCCLDSYICVLVWKCCRVWGSLKGNNDISGIKSSFVLMPNTQFSHQFNVFPHSVGLLRVEKLKKDIKTSDFHARWFLHLVFNSLFQKNMYLTPLVRTPCQRANSWITTTDAVDIHGLQRMIPKFSSGASSVHNKS